MKPIRTPLSTGLDIGPMGSNVSPLPTFRETNELGVTAVFSVWTFSPAERERIARGANVLVGVFKDPMPPLSLGVVDGPGFEDMGGTETFGDVEGEA